MFILTQRGHSALVTAVGDTLTMDMDTDGVIHTTDGEDMQDGATQATGVAAGDIQVIGEADTTLTTTTIILMEEEVLLHIMEVETMLTTETTLLTEEATILTEITPLTEIATTQTEAIQPTDQVTALLISEELQL